MTINWVKRPTTDANLGDAVAKYLSVHPDAVKMFLAEYTTSQPKEIAVKDIPSIVGARGKQWSKGQGPFTFSTTETQLIQKMKTGQPVGMPVLLYYSRSTTTPQILTGNAELDLCAFFHVAPKVIAVTLSASSR